MNEHTVLEEVDTTFGKGLCYSLALFLTHAAEYKHHLAKIEMVSGEGGLQFDGKKYEDEREKTRIIQELAAIGWFTEAERPLRNLVISTSLPDSLQNRLKEMQSKCRTWSLPQGSKGKPSKEDVQWAIQEAKELIRNIDEYKGTETVKEQNQHEIPSDPILIFKDKQL